MLMRIILTHLTPLDRQTTESINILEGDTKPGESLNTKTEWGGAKIPGILVTQPKGVAKVKGEDGDSQDPGSGQQQDLEQVVLEPQVWQKGGKRGIKRLKYLGDDSKFNMFSEDEGGTRDIQDVELVAPKLEKRRRSRSPDLKDTPKPPAQDQKSQKEKSKTPPH